MDQEQIKNWIKENWFKLGGLVCALVLVSSMGYYYVIFVPHLEQQKIDLAQDKMNQEKVVEEAKINAQTQKAAIDVQTEQANIKAKQARASKVNSCIADSKVARDLPLASVEYVWQGCIQDTKVDSGFCDGLKTKANSNIYRKYNEWVDECNRGMQPNFKEYIY